MNKRRFQKHKFWQWYWTSKRAQIGSGCAILAVVILICTASVATFSIQRLSVVNTNPKPGPIVGYVSFISSGQLNADSSLGINDELLIQLHNVPNPPPGKSYYAWLLSDIDQVDLLPILLPTVYVHNGEVNDLYSSPHHINLLATMSRILITEEDANITPTNPSPNLSTWRYSAELPQTPDPKDTAHHFSLLTHLRFLLSEDPMIKEMGLSGGLSIECVRSTGKVLEWAGNARDDWTSRSITLLRDQLIRILEYIDGQSLVKVDLPSSMYPLLNSHLANIPLLGSAVLEQMSSGYFHEIGGHLIAIAQAPGVTHDELELVNQINIAINHVTNWLEKVLQDAKQLVKMTGAQLLQPSSLAIMDDMQTQAFYAYAGRLDPITNKVQAGVTQIYYDIERLATIGVTSYTLK